MHRYYTYIFTKMESAWWGVCLLIVLFERSHQTQIWAITWMLPDFDLWHCQAFRHYARSPKSLRRTESRERDGYCGRLWEIAGDSGRYEHIVLDNRVWMFYRGDAQSAWDRPEATKWSRMMSWRGWLRKSIKHEKHAGSGAP